MVPRPHSSSNLRGKPLFIYFRKNSKLYFRATDNLVKKYDCSKSLFNGTTNMAQLNGENFVVPRPPCSSNLRGKPLFIYFRKNGKLYFRATDNLVKKYDRSKSLFNGTTNMAHTKWRKFRGSQTPCSSNLRGKPLFIYFRKNSKLYFRATDNMVKKYGCSKSLFNGTTNMA